MKWAMRLKIVHRPRIIKLYREEDTAYMKKLNLLVREEVEVIGNQ